jgi:hypothetical protein
MRRLSALFATVGLWMAVCAAAQDATPPPAAPPTQTAAPAATPADPAADPGAPAPAADPPVVLDPKAPAKTEVNLDRRTLVTAGIGFSGPIGAGASLRLIHGLGADVKDGSTRVKAVCGVPMPHCAQGFLLQADAGSGGGKLSLGVGARAHVDEETFKGTAGFALRVAFARTWGNPVGTDPGLNYLGPELDLSVIRIGLTLGVLFRVSGDHGPNAVFSWGLGFGL